MVVVLSRFRVANGLEHDVREAFLARPRLVDLMPGFLGLETYTDAQSPEIFYLVTRWVDAPSYQRWHRSAHHRQSHAGMPTGLKLDPSFTRVIVGERIEAASVAPPETIVADASGLFAAFLMQSSRTCCVVVSREGTIRYSNPAFDALLGQGPAGAAALPLARCLTEPDALRLATWSAGARAARTTPVLLNFLKADGRPTTLRCHIDIHGDELVIVGEPDGEADASMQTLLVDLNNQLNVTVRENARQKRQLEQTYWQLKKIGDLLPICVDCGKVKTDATTWQDVRTFFQDQSGFLTHGYCPDCAARLLAAWDVE